MIESVSTITSKGQITIPAEVRRRLGLKQGDRVSFVLEDGHAIMKPKGSVTTATAGAFRGSGPVLSAEELREAAEYAIAEDVRERSKNASDPGSDRIPGITRTEP
jgi:AbrB family looped-hinge helix DNA binding protein